MGSIFETAQTALFTPGNRPDRLHKALASPADVVIADLEDAVGVADKATARTSVTQFLAEAHRPVIVRINPVTTAAGQTDQEAIAAAIEHGSVDSAKVAIMIPKFQLDDDLVNSINRLPAGVSIIGLIETVQGVFDACELAQLAGVVRLALGAADLSAEIGCAPEGQPINSSRSTVVMSSVAAGIYPPFDTPCFDFTDQTVMGQHGQRALKDGFGGSLCIHPRQLEPVKAAFQPTREQIEWAKKVTAADDGASAIDGQMIDAPVIRQAQAVLDRAGL